MTGLLLLIVLVYLFGWGWLWWLVGGYIVLIVITEILEA
jgi:hypothetical protein